MSLSFLVNDVSIDPQQSFHLKLLSYLLLDGSSSPMYKALIDSNIGQEYSSNVGYDGATKVASFSFGLQGIKYEDVSKVEEIILNVLREASKKGFNKSRIDAALHLLELNTKRQSAQFGLALSHQVISSWVYEMPVESVLQINKQIEKFKEAFAKGDLFESLIGRYFLGNDRRVLFVMKPDESFNSRLAEAEQRLLEEKIKKLQPQDHKKLFETNLKLLKLQETKEGN